MNIPASLKVLAAVAGLAAFGQASAIPVTFEFNGVCTNYCANLGLQTGAAVTGGIVTSDAALSNNNLAGNEISDFYIDFGWFSLNDWNSDIYNTSLNLSADGQTFSSGWFKLDGIFGIFPGSELDFIANETTNQWTFVLPLFADPIGTGSFRRVESVPEPATLSLLGAGLVAVGLMRRRKQHNKA